MFRRRTFVKTLGAAGVVSFAGCSSNQGNNTENGSDTINSDDTNSSAAALVEEYYTAAANGNLEEAASCLSMTQFEEGSGDRASVEQLTDIFRDRGMSQSGTDVSLGEFNELSVSEFAAFTFLGEEGNQQQLGEERLRELFSSASAFGGDDEPITIVHYTGGFLPDIWVPYQPPEEPDSGWGEVIIEVGSFGGEPYIIGDFRTYTDFKVVDN